jgi:hypothetical protein
MGKLIGTKEIWIIITMDFRMRAVCSPLLEILCSGKEDNPCTTVLFKTCKLPGKQP